jgi:3-deoxy-manno-octulosonate cytidylyltransferase (CMP-KDO synthetase)
MKNVVVIIPARMGSSRFPGKPLHPILGRPMIDYCMQNAALAVGEQSTWVATCDEAIFRHVNGCGANVVMTSANHERASDRTAEAASLIESKTGEIIDIVVMLQGDEPLIDASMIISSYKPLIDDETILVSNLMAPIQTEKEFNDPNEVKVVTGLDNNALYFSREPVPSKWKLPGEVKMMKQVCSIPFQRNFLETFNALSETPLERVESVDMLRVLEHGISVKMVFVDKVVQSVDTRDDAIRVEEILNQRAVDC